jgi:hypothetical protein
MIPTKEQIAWKYAKQIAITEFGVESIQQQVLSAINEATEELEKQNAMLRELLTISVNWLNKIIDKNKDLPTSFFDKLTLTKSIRKALSTTPSTSDYILKSDAEILLNSEIKKERVFHLALEEKFRADFQRSSEEQSELIRGNILEREQLVKNSGLYL